MFCMNCGAQLPDEANFCWKCGKPQKEGAKVEEPNWEICEIVWKEVKASLGGLGGIHGYFWAKAIGPNGVYESGRTQTFKIKGAWSPDSAYKEDVAVHNTLISLLVQNGWEPTTERGSTWWSHSFRRKARARQSETKNIVDLVLLDAGPRKNETIIIIRQITDLSLGEAKTLAETRNGIILKSVPRNTALQAQLRFEKAGAVVKIE